MGALLPRLALLVPLLLGGAGAGAPGAADLSVAVIVHPSCAETPDLKDIARIYLRERRFWADGTAILPVGQAYGCAVRRRFEARVFGARAATLARHWDQLYFQGVLPPPTLASDAAVREYVAARPGAIGYLDARFVDDSVRVVLRR